MYECTNVGIYIISRPQDAAGGTLHPIEFSSSSAIEMQDSRTVKWRDFVWENAGCWHVTIKYEPAWT